VLAHFAQWADAGPFLSFGPIGPFVLCWAGVRPFSFSLCWAGAGPFQLNTL